MNLVDLVALCAVAQYLAFGALVGRARNRYGVKAPAVTGSEPFERVYRVQMNTLEVLVALIPSLYVASRYWSSTFVAATGLVYLVGRFVYRSSYIASPERRSLGFLLSIVPVGVLLVAGIAGAAMGRG